jgi:hypothetical protein
MKQPTPSYSSSICLANENPIHADENTIVSKSFDSLSDLILDLHDTFEPTNSSYRILSTADFEVYKAEIIHAAQRNKCHFAFGVLIVSNEDATETRYCTMLRPMTAKYFAQEMLDQVKKFYKNNPSVDFKQQNRGCFENLITLLTKELTIVFTAVNPQTLDATTDVMLKEYGQSPRIDEETGSICFKPTEENR